MASLSEFFEKNAALLPPDALISHIVWRFHDAHRKELPLLVELARQFESVHARGSNLLSGLLEQVAQDLERHMAEEEQVLFPLMLSTAGFKLDPPIKHILLEHEQHTALLERIEETVRDYVGPEVDIEAPALVAGLRKFLNDLRDHLEIENKALFPQFLKGR